VTGDQLCPLVARLRLGRPVTAYSCATLQGLECACIQLVAMLIGWQKAFQRVSPSGYGLAADGRLSSRLEINCVAAVARSLCGKRFRNSRAVAKAR
jgi:hypothetical protein